jgi:hypothetical protein
MAPMSIPLNWNILADLRDRFLTNRTDGDYWLDDETLECYDATFAERIGWKIDYALDEASARGWTPEPDSVLFDWGCGTGVAARRMLRRWPNFTKVILGDQSRKAAQFATKKILTEFPDCKISLWEGENPTGSLVLTASHLWNELDGRGRAQLLNFAKQSRTCFFVEPGTPELSKQLVSVREALRGELSAVAPCPHQSICGLAGGNTKNWCHHFATPSPEVFTTAFWRKFGETLNIDLRSLPVSYLVMTKNQAGVNVPGAAEALGRPRIYKGYAQITTCRQAGVTEDKILKRDDPEKFKTLKRRV